MTQDTAVSSPGNEARNSLPDPLVPADTDLRQLPYMPLDVQRLRDSDLGIESTGDEFRAAVMLWCASWHQVPAASLPDDDRLLAAFAGYGRDVRTWKKVRPMALRGFVLCSDGRLYHPVIAEKATDARESHEAYRERISASNERVANYRNEHKRLRAALAENGVSVPWDAPMARLRELAATNNISLETETTGNAHVTVTGEPPVTQNGNAGNAPVMPYNCKGKGKGKVSPAAQGARAGVRTPARARIWALLDDHGIVYRDRADSRDPIVLASWDDYTDDQILAAIQRAQAVREDEGDTSPISVRFVDSILRRMSNADSSSRRAGGIARADQVGDEFLRQYGAASTAAPGA